MTDNLLATEPVVEVTYAPEPVIDVTAPGPQGPRGEQGEMGGPHFFIQTTEPVGAQIGDFWYDPDDDTPQAPAIQVYEHTQTVAQATWTINHTLGHNPFVVQVFDQGGVILSEWALTFSIPNVQIVIGFDVPMAGVARLV